MTDVALTEVPAPAGSDDLLEASWSDRGRAVRGRELRLELLMTATFAAGVVTLLAIGPVGSPAPVAALAVIAYAIAARADFPIGSGHVVPTQLFLVPLFAVTSAALVPVLVFAGLALGLLGEVLLGRSRPDRLAYCGGDAMHALGPALVICVLAGGNAVEAAPFVLLLAFAAQLAFDCASSSLHDLLVFGTRPRLHARVLLQVWGVDAALAPIGLLVAETSQSLGWAVLAPLPLVALLSAMSADRSRRIGQAHERLGALNRERRRREEAVQRVGDALASNLELREAESRLRHQAFHDGLTGLPNRTLFAERVTRATTRTRATPQPLAVAFLDLDGFKLVNDTLGHEAGDELLVTVADRITGCLRPSDTAARLGGDEFAVLLEDLQVPGEAEAVAERLRVALRRPVLVRDRQFVVRASVGFAFQTAEESADTLLRRADLAMYAAKKEGGDCARRFEPDMLTAADARAELVNDLGTAIALGRLDVHFQPIVTLAEERIHAIEALTRWHHPRRGLVAPDTFIPLAEETGLIGDLGRLILDEACRIAVTWPDLGDGPPRVTVNVSSAQLRLTGFAPDVAESLTRHGLPAARLVLEVTESVALTSDPETQATLAALRRLGVGIALDDFGTGWSSLSYLARTKVDLLKLDRAFLAGVESDPVQARLVAGVIGLADSLGIAVVAEGIESDEQLSRLVELGGHLGQGYLFGRPMDAEALAEGLAAATPAVRRGRLTLAS